MVHLKVQQFGGSVERSPAQYKCECRHCGQSPYHLASSSRFMEITEITANVSGVLSKLVITPVQLVRRYL